MIIYYNVMRLKDEHKQESIIQSTIKLVNEIGFVSSSVSKIAKEANVSPATIYIYYKNKEDLLVSTYVEIKKKFGAAFLKDFDDRLPIRDILKISWKNGFDFIEKNPDLLQYTEQFSNSPFSSLVNKSDVEKYFEPLIQVLKKGIEQKIIKDIDYEILVVFMFHPIMILSNKRLCSNFEINDTNIGIAFTLAWDAIKL